MIDWTNVWITLALVGGMAIVGWVIKKDREKLKYESEKKEEEIHS